MITVDGDGTVADQSLSLCRKWEVQRNQVIEIPNASHMDMLQGSEAIAAVLKILQRPK